MNWKPIETAPLDGTRILANWKSSTGRAYIVNFNGVEWKTDAGGVFGCAPTHWMPLPVWPDAQEDETESLKFKNTHLLAVIAELRDKITSLESREQDGSEEINLLENQNNEYRELLEASLLALDAMHRGSLQTGNTRVSSEIMHCGYRAFRETRMKLLMALFPTAEDREREMTYAEQEAIEHRCDSTMRRYERIRDFIAYCEQKQPSTPPAS